MDDVTSPSRGLARSSMRRVRCKDCVREALRTPNGADAPDVTFEYAESWGADEVDHGRSRSDRCPRHRAEHSASITGLAVAYIDLETIGTVADRESPGGPLGGLGPLPELHRPVESTVDLAQYAFGMTDSDISEILDLLSDPVRRVLILKAGTGTGKSTFAPFRLMSPPNDATFRLTDLGPIVVTEPRVQATTGVARFVGEKLVAGCTLKECSNHGSFDPSDHPSGHPGPRDSGCEVFDCARHVGPGYRVGYQIRGDRQMDGACELVYVTDGTVTNWFKAGRLDSIGTIIVDEAHERSTNIDFILGFLKRDLDRYPHLRVIVTSATFDPEFYRDFFGPQRVNVMTIAATKAFGYGAPIFPLSAEEVGLPCGCEGADAHERDVDESAWIQRHWPIRLGPSRGAAEPEDLHAITRALLPLRFGRTIDPAQWPTSMAAAAAEQIVALVSVLEHDGIPGDVLAFLPNSRLIREAIEQLEGVIDRERSDIYALIQSESNATKEAALAPRAAGSKRKIVISTNLAETSLTVSGVRFVIDSGLISQGAWDPVLAAKTVPTTAHSRAGVRQRWGRVGRDAPGWVFPLYSRAAYDGLLQDTPPGSLRENLESLVLKAKEAGVDDIADFPWPAAHEFVGADPLTSADTEAFRSELARSSNVLSTTGLVDGDGDISPFGREIAALSEYSSSFAFAVVLADQLSCAPEVITALLFLDGQKPRDGNQIDLRNLRVQKTEWPGEWQLAADRRWSALSALCRDELELVLRIVDLWEGADSERAPWEATARRSAWARQWFVDEAPILAMAALRRQVLQNLSPAMKEEVKRPVDIALVHRARACINRAFVNQRWQVTDAGWLAQNGVGNEEPAQLSNNAVVVPDETEVLALTRSRSLRGRAQLAGLVAVDPSACDPSVDAMALIEQLASGPRPEDSERTGYARVTRRARRLPAGLRLQLTPTVLESRVLAIAETDVVQPFVPNLVSDGSRRPRPHSRRSDQPVYSSTGWPAGLHIRLLDDDQLAYLAAFGAADGIDEDTSIPEPDAVAGLDDAAVDPLELWRSAVDGSTRDDLKYRVVGESSASGWYEVAGYDEDAVIIEATLNPTERDPDPSVHSDLFDGDLIEITVGASIAPPGGNAKWRVFTRDDGGGRFLVGRGWRRSGLDDPYAHPPTTLDLKRQELLTELTEGTRLTAHVIRTGFGTTTISLLPALSEHLAGFGRVVSAPGSTRSVREYDAVVSRTPDASRAIAVELLARDSARGIVHEFTVPAERTRSVEAELGLAPETELAVGTPVVVQFSCPAELAMDEQTARSIAAPSREVWVPKTRVGVPTVLKANGPISLALTRALLECAVGPEWAAAVWAFHLESHLRRISHVGVGRSSDVSEIPIGPEEPVQTSGVERLQPGTSIPATVTAVLPSALRLALADGSAARSIHPDTSARVGDAVLTRVVGVAADGITTVDLRRPVGMALQLPDGTRDRVLASDRDKAFVGRFTLDGTQLIAAFTDAAQADAGLARLEADAEAHHAVFVVPADRVGRAIGKGGSTLNALRAVPDVISVEFAADGALLVVAGSATALAAATDRLSAAVGVAPERTVEPGGSRTVRIVRDGRTVARDFAEDPSRFERRTPWAPRSRVFTAAPPQPFGSGLTGDGSSSTILLEQIIAERSRGDGPPIPGDLMKPRPLIPDERVVPVPSGPPLLVRDGCVVYRGGADHYVVVAANGRGVSVPANDYRRDARPLYWIRLAGETGDERS